MYDATVKSFLLTGFWSQVPLHIIVPLVVVYIRSCFKISNALTRNRNLDRARTMVVNLIFVIIAVDIWYGVIVYFKCARSDTCTDFLRSTFARSSTQIASYSSSPTQLKSALLQAPLLALTSVFYLIGKWLDKWTVNNSVVFEEDSQVFEEDSCENTDDRPVFEKSVPGEGSTVLLETTANSTDDATMNSLTQTPKGVKRAGRPIVSGARNTPTPRRESVRLKERSSISKN